MIYVMESAEEGRSSQEEVFDTHVTGVVNASNPP
jgi:hypothetical protein